MQSYQENGEADCFEVVAEEGKKALLFFTQVLAVPNMRSRNLLLQGLNENARYRIWRVSLEGEELLEDTGRIASGAVLMNAGLILERPWGDFQGRLLYLEEVE